MGGGEFLWLLHEVPYKSKLLQGAWQLSPYLKTFCVFLIATRNIPSIKNTSGFRGFIFGLAVRLNIAPIRCNYFPLCPIGRFVGVNSTQKIKKYHWKCVEEGLWENGMHVACGMEMSISLKLCGAEVYVCNEVEMKCWFGRGTKPTGTNVARMERIYRKHAINTTLIFLFFCNNYWVVGNSVVSFIGGTPKYRTD